MFIINLKKSVLLTYLGVIFGVISMTLAFTKMAFAEVEYMRYSLVLLILAGICDMFDGKVARMCKRTKEEKNFGIQIDSLADTVNFLVLPVVIMLSLGMTSVLDMCIYIVFILCGISRLALFNCNADLDKPVPYYNGLPVTSTSVIYPLIGLFHGRISDSAFHYVCIFATLIVGLLFITKIKVPKFKKTITLVIITIIAVLWSILLLWVR